MEVRRRAASSVVGVTPTPSETSAEDVHHNSTTSLGTAEAIVPGSSPHPSEEGILPEEGPEAVGGCTRFVRAFRGSDCIFKYKFYLLFYLTWTFTTLSNLITREKNYAENQSFFRASYS